MDKIRQIKNPELFLIITILALAFFTWGQSHPTLPDPDGFYHMKVAQLMATQDSLVIDFPWLPLTTLNENYADQNWLYHLYLIPFSFFNNPLVGLKVATLIISTAIIFSLFWFLKKQKIKYPLFYTMLAFTSLPFILRISISKATPLAVLFLIISLYFIFNNKPRALGLLCLLYAWIHGSWIIVLIAALVYWLADSGFIIFKLRNNFNKLRFKTIAKSIFSSSGLKLLAAGLLGSFTGLIINPYFPANLKFFWQQSILIPIQGYKNIINVGAEWHGFPVNGLIASSFAVFILFILAIIIFIKKYRQIGRSEVTLLILSGLLFVATLNARRNVEFLIPVLIIFIAFLFNKLGISPWPWFKEHLYKFFRNRTSIYLINTLIIIVGLTSIITNLIVYNDLMRRFPIDRYQAASIWLQQNTKPGDTILNASFDSFPTLMYWLDDRQYVIGLDPVFLYLKEPDTHQIWQAIAQDNVRPDPETLQNKFNSQTLFIKNSNIKLKNSLNYDDDWQIKYYDSEVSIYQPR